MGLMVDTNVFILFEKSGKALDLSPWEPSEGVFVSVVTVSELLMGVHRANTDERRQRRSAFVEAVISGVAVLDFTIASARVHAELYAELAKRGQMIGAHDLMIAAPRLTPASPKRGRGASPVRGIRGARAKSSRSCLLSSLSPRRSRLAIPTPAVIPRAWLGWRTRSASGSDATRPG